MFSRNANRFAPLIAAAVVLSACQKPNDVAIASTQTYEMDASTLIGPPCQHKDSPYSERVCADTTRTNDYFRPSDVVAETLMVHLTGGRTVRLVMPNRTDAIFLSKSALETFLLRHYDANDTTKARELREFIAHHFH